MQRQVCVGLYPGGETNGFLTAALTQPGFLFLRRCCQKNENIKEKYQFISLHECDNVIALIGCEQRYRFSYTGYIVYKKKREESHDPSLFTC